MDAALLGKGGIVDNRLFSHTYHEVPSATRTRTQSLSLNLEMSSARTARFAN